MIEVVKRRLNPQLRESTGIIIFFSILTIHLATIVTYLVDECDFVLPAELGDAKGIELL